VRRPSPLPTPAPRAASRGAEATLRGTTSAADRPEPTEPASVGTDPGRDETGSAAASVPGRPDAWHLDPAAPRAGGAADESADAPVGIRDVWRASRARRRALRAEVRRFTVRQRRRRAIWIGVAASFVLLVAGTFGAAYSPLFAIQHITVVGTHGLQAATVAAALKGEIGTPLPSVDDSAVKAALVRFPLVESYTLEARPPHELVVRIVERTPVGVVQGPAGYTLVDAAGVALSTTSTAPAGQPVITAKGGVDSDAFASAGLVMRSLPSSIRSQVTAVSATSPDAVILSLGRTRTSVVWGSADDSAKKALALQSVMKARPPAGVREYDVSAPDAVVVR
jgi:cell division protein FtsQ